MNEQTQWAFNICNSGSAIPELCECSEDVFSQISLERPIESFALLNNGHDKQSNGSVSICLMSVLYLLNLYVNHSAFTLVQICENEKQEIRQKSVFDCILSIDQPFSEQIEQLQTLLEEKQNSCESQNGLLTELRFSDQDIYFTYLAGGMDTKQYTWPGHLNFAFSINKAQITCTLIYRTTHYTTGQIGAFSNSLTSIMDFIGAYPDLTFRRYIDYANCAALDIYKSLNNQVSQYPDQTDLYQLLSKQKNNTDGKIVMGDKMWSYSQLFSYAGQIAGLLKHEGVQNGEIVGVLLDRSVESIGILLGILQIGAVCLPLDVEFPRTRNYAILEDSCAGYLITESKFKKQVQGKFKVLLLDQLQLSKYQINETHSPVCADDPAYIIYTSGSTGIPKGVILTHKGIINHLFIKQAELNLEKSDVFAHNFSFNVVASIWLSFLPVFLGAQMHLYTGETLMKPYRLMEMVRNDQVTFLALVPTFLITYLNMLESGTKVIELPLLRQMLVTGEKISVGNIQTLYKYYEVDIINAYGQSECSDDTLHKRFTKSMPIPYVTIGRPAYNTQVYIFDDNMMLKPEYGVGTLYIAGDGKALGYLNKPELTDRQWIQHPLISGDILYNTGDTARLLGNGEIEFIGRNDNQIKIHGNRVELDDIGIKIMEMHDVKQAVVVDRYDDNMHYVLCAFVVTFNSVSASTISRYLSERLPQYMVPSYIVLVDSIPQTPNGKPDRLSLRKYHLVQEPAMLEVQSNNTQDCLLHLWQEILDHTNIGIDDDFFAVGGTSILMIQLYNLLDQLYPGKVKLGDLFIYTTIRKLASYLDK